MRSSPPGMLRRLSATLVVAVALGCAVATGAGSQSAGVRLIAFFAPGKGFYDSLWVVSSSKGSKPKELVPNTWDAFGSSWSPDGTRLAVTMNNRENSDLSDIFVVNSNGTGLTQVTHGGHAEDVSWSPDGKMLAFEWTADRIDGPTWIDVANADGSHLHPLLSTRVDGVFQWSLNGEQMTVDTGSSAYLIDVRKRSILSRYPSHPRAEFRTWSPDERRIAFAASTRLPNGTYPPHLYVADVARRGAHKLALPGLYPDQPAWSPDGNLIAFTGQKACGRRLDLCEAIFVVKPDGSGLRQLTPYATRSTEATWSQDGQQIAYVGSRGVYVMNANGTHRERVATTAQVDNLAPLTWQPRS